MDVLDRANDILVFTDVETTDLHPGEGKLLEVACLITDPQLNLLDEQGFQQVIHYTAEDTAAMFDASPEVVQSMHAKTGLWDKLPEGMPVEQVDEALLGYIKNFAPVKRNGYVAGNSIRLDMNFLDAFLPKTSAHLHYRFVDISGVENLLYWWANFDSGKGETPHTAMDDIRMSLKQLQAVKTFLKM